MRPTCSPAPRLNVAEKNRYNAATSIAASEEDENLWPAASALAYPPAHGAEEAPAAAAAPCSRTCTPDSRDGFMDMADHDMPPRLVEDPAQLAHVPAPPS